MVGLCINSIKKAYPLLIKFSFHQITIFSPNRSLLTVKYKYICF